MNSPHPVYLHFAGKPAEEELVFGNETDTAAYFGRLAEARELSRRAADAADRAGQQESGGAPGIYAVSALRESLFGNADKANQLVALSRKLSGGRDTSDWIVGQNDYALALALACAGDLSSAQALADDLNRRFPEYTLMQVNYIPTLRAKLALSRGSSGGP